MSSQEIYVSTDVEADGPVLPLSPRHPGSHSSHARIVTMRALMSVTFDSNAS